MQRRQLLSSALNGWFGLVIMGSPRVATGAERQQPAADDALAAAAVILGAVSPSAANSYRLQLVRGEWAPGSSAAILNRSGAHVYCVANGELTIRARAGAATLWRSQGLGEEPVGQIMPLHEQIVCRAGDCLAFDADTAPAQHDTWNDGSEPVVVWKAQLALVPFSKQWQCG